VITLAAKHRLVVTIEDGIRVGGIGTRIRQELRAAGVDTALSELGLPDEFLEHGSRAEILAQRRDSPQRIARDVVEQVLGSKVPVARPLGGWSTGGAFARIGPFLVRFPPNALFASATLP
jgi:1-deoxy-D-xylulose-5-phosphate synthase